VLTTLVPGPLSRAMREGSRQEHEDAENSRFMSALLAGEVDEAGYAGYLQRLRVVYEQLEDIGRSTSDDPLVSAVLDPALDRLEALDADLAFWSTGPSTPVDSPAAAGYVAQLECTTAWGGLYAAHHYTRYLGDLSGGQAIGRILRREFDLGADSAGVAFYDFAQIPKPKPYKDAYRARLDAVQLDIDQKTRIVDEVKTAFRLNQALFNELDGTLEAHRRTPRAS
jgi:heme oxygenase